MDGGTHDEPEQAARDALEDSILAMSSLPILRLRTVESGIEKKIAGFLSAWARASANEEPATVSES